MFRFVSLPLIVACCLLRSPACGAEERVGQEPLTPSAKATKKKKKKKSEPKKPELGKKSEQKAVDKKQAGPGEQLPVDKSRFAAADLEEVDSDFVLQGEYMGLVQPDPHYSDTGALQLVAAGDGKFDGVLYRGGLPGAGWDRVTKQKISGRSDGRQATLKNDKWTITVCPTEAVVRDSSGRHWGTFSKIHRISSTQDAPPPAGAISLFNGRDTAQFDNAKMTETGLLSVGATTKMSVHDFHMHVEFRTPYMPYARGQGRGNSGVYIQRRYEVQILDSFGLDGLDNECGGLYKQKAPDVNMCFPPLSWQTYDIYFAAPQWSSTGHRLVPANITVLHNGEPIHFNYRITNKTGGGAVEGPENLPILFQNHGNPVTFRNIWIAPLIPESGMHLATEFCPPGDSLMPGSPAISPTFRGRLFRGR